MIYTLAKWQLSQFFRINSDQKQNIAWNKFHTTKIKIIFVSHKWSQNHCVERVRIQSYSGPHFFRIFPHSDWTQSFSPYTVRMWKNAGKMRTRITPNKITFYVVFKRQFILRIVWLSNPRNLMQKLRQLG